ncbi:MAG: carbohydrate kinase [Ruminococcaceae bacterium]|nr:carbohydrate kinase [Oscillospiraceae bacterium]
MNNRVYDIVALGELLIDFTPCGVSETGMKMVEMNPGGAVANVLCAASRLGLSTGFIGKVGEDAHGRYLRAKLCEYGVEPVGLIASEEAPTTLAFVDIDDNGERSFSFIRDPGADTLLRADELSDEVLSRARVLHVGSLSMTAEPSRSATLEAIRRAKAAGALITYDPNYRELLWSGEEEAVKQMRSLLPLADMVKISDNEAVLLTGKESPVEALGVLTDMGIKCAVVTVGADGAYVGAGGETALVESFRRDAVDTTGAGDAFWGGFLTSFIRDGADIESITLESAVKHTRFGCAVAACCVMKRGAMPAMPDEAAVASMLEE